jgi:hypothetical protein
MIANSSTYRTVTNDGTYTPNRTLVQVVQYQSSPAIAVYFHYQLHDSGTLSLPTCKFMLARDVAYSMLSDLNQTISGNYAAVDNTYDTVDKNGNKNGTLHVHASLIPSPTISITKVPVSFKLTVTQDSGVVLPPVSFQLNRTDASLIPACINAVVNSD